MNQLCVYLYPLPLEPPSGPPIPPFQVTTEHRAELPVLHSGFPLPLCFTYGSVYTSVPTCLSSHPPSPTQLQSSVSRFMDPAVPSTGRRREEISLEKPTALASAPLAPSPVRPAGQPALPVQKQLPVIFPCHPLNYKWKPNHHKWKQIQRIKSLACRDLQVSGAPHSLGNWPSFPQPQIPLSCSGFLWYDLAALVLWHLRGLLYLFSSFRR